MKSTKRASLVEMAMHRQKMAIAVGLGDKPRDVARTFGVSFGTVYAACREHGVKPNGHPHGFGTRQYNAKVPKNQWLAVNWRERDAKIARQLAVSRERVRVVRLSLGMMSPQITARDTDRINLAMKT
jgi:hypothetical protein